MSQDVGNQIRNFQFDLNDSNVVHFLDSAYDIGLLPLPLCDSLQGDLNEHGYYRMETLFPDETVTVVSLAADNFTHRAFVFLGLQIGLFPSTFLEHLEFGLQDEEFGLEDNNSIGLLMQGVEHALHEAFNRPLTQTEVPRKKNFSQLMGRETVEIIVGEGEDAKSFVVHKDLLMDKVPFFEKMFNSQFLESSTGSATLPEDSSEAFEVLVEWVYRSTVKTLHKTDCAKTSRTDLAISTVALAEKYLLSELGDRAMSSLAKIGENVVPTMSQMSTLYEQTPPNSNARIYAVREVEWALINPEADEVTSTSIHAAFQDSDLLLDAIIDMRGKKALGHERVYERAHTFPICDYHNHSKPVIALASPCPYDECQRKTTSQPSIPIKRTVKKKGTR